ncbi:MAG: thiamine diphosphokinase [Spirochaetales bacterium]|nr:thiamine diphosphokinase [Spirochaetales bacterium]
MIARFPRGELLIAGADSGIDFAFAHGVEPDFYIGDMDSLKSRKRLKEGDPEKVFIYPPDKDQTDTELGLEQLWSGGCDRVCLWGGGGGRMDHFMAILALFERDRTPDCWYTRRECFRVIRDRFVLEGFAGRRVSLFPLGSGPWKMTSRGLKWPLESLDWRRGDFGISNRVVSDSLEISVLKGRVMIVNDLGGRDRR